MEKVTLKISGMSCSACSNGLEKYLNKQEKILNATVNLVTSLALIEYTDLTIEEINNYIKEAGFESLGIYDETKEEKQTSKDKICLVIFFIIILILMYISMHEMLNLPMIELLNIKKYPKIYSIVLLILTIPFLIYGIDIIKKGIKNIIHKTPNMDTLVTIGIFSSFIYSITLTILILLGNNSYVNTLYYDSTAMVIFIVKLGRYIDSKSKKKTTEHIKELVQITPLKAVIKIGNEEKEVTIDEVRKNDLLICRPGEKIAVDGTIVKGKTHIDESFITGEYAKVLKKEEDKVIAGSINYDGYIEYTAEKIGKNSTISEMVRLVVDATNTKAPIAKLADKVSGIFVPVILIIASITFILYLLLGYPLNESLVSFVTVLTVACPCALGLATPLAIVIGEGLCAKKGILVKKSETLENAHKIDVVVFDKTGTLTYGKPKVSKIFNYSKYKEQELLEIVAILENKSTHPIANAFKEYKISKEVKDFENIPGIGIKGTIDKKEIYIGNNKLFEKLNIENNYKKDELELTTTGNSILYIIEEKQVQGLIGVNDIVKKNAKKTITTLKSMGKQVIMLTGDNKDTAKLIGGSLGIDKIISNVMPKEKTKVIKDLMKNSSVMMVGDGINDAPALALADISVSFKNGTDIASNSSDVILMNDDLLSIINLIKISKKTLRTIKQNLFWAFFYNSCMVPIAIGILRPTGIVMNPMIASIAMTFSSITVVLNSLRLRK